MPDTALDRQHLGNELGDLYRAAMMMSEFLAEGFASLRAAETLAKKAFVGDPGRLPNAPRIIDAVDRIKHDYRDWDTAAIHEALGAVESLVTLLDEERKLVRDAS